MTKKEFRFKVSKMKMLLVMMQEEGLLDKDELRKVLRQLKTIIAGQTFEVDFNIKIGLTKGLDQCQN